MVVATLSSRTCPVSSCDPPPEMAEEAVRVVGGNPQPLCEWLVVARGLSWLNGGVGKESPGCPECRKCPGERDCESSPPFLDLPFARKVCAVFAAEPLLAFLSPVLASLVPTGLEVRDSS